MRKVRSHVARAAQAVYRYAIETTCAVNHATGRSGIHSNSLLLVRTDGIGDFVLFTPALRHIRRLFEGHRISMIVNQVTADLARACPCLDEVIPCDMARYRRDFPYRVKTIRNLRTRNFDTAIYPVYSQEPLAQELTYCTGAKETVVVVGDISNITASLKKRNEKHFSRRLFPSLFSSGVRVRAKKRTEADLENTEALPAQRPHPTCTRDGTHQPTSMKTPSPSSMELIVEKASRLITSWQLRGERE